MSREETKVLRGILATLDDASPDTLITLAEALAFGDWYVAHFATPLRYLATDRQSGDEPSALTLLALRSALHMASCSESFREHLEGAQQAFWVAVREALDDGEVLRGYRAAT